MGEWRKTDHYGGCRQGRLYSILTFSGSITTPAYFICDMYGDPSKLIFGLKGTSEVFNWLQGGVDRDAYGNDQLIAIRSIHHVRQAESNAASLDMSSFSELVELLNERHMYRAQPLRCLVGKIYSIPGKNAVVKNAYFIGPKPDQAGVYMFGLQGTPETCKWLQGVDYISMAFVDKWLAYREARVVREAAQSSERFDLSMLEELGVQLCKKFTENISPLRRARLDSRALYPLLEDDDAGRSETAHARRERDELARLLKERGERVRKITSNEAQHRLQLDAIRRGFVREKKI